MSLPPPDTLSRVVQLQADRQAVLRWLASVPQQHLPRVAAWVEAQTRRARTADEATIQAMLEALGLTQARQRGRKMDAAAFWLQHHALRESWQAQHGRTPSQSEEAAALGIGRKTLYRYLRTAPGPRKKRKNLPKTLNDPM